MRYQDYSSEDEYKETHLSRDSKIPWSPQDSVSKRREEECVVENKPTRTSSFLARFGSIPIIKDSLNTTLGVVNKYSLGRMALIQAEKTVSTMCSRADWPLNSTWEHINEFGHSLLDDIEQAFPLVNAPTQDLVESFESLEIKERVLDTFDTIQTLLIPQQQLDSLLGTVETTIDHYLPEKEPNHQASDEPRLVRIQHMVTTILPRLEQRVCEPGLTLFLPLLSVKNGLYNYASDIFKAPYMQVVLTTVQGESTALRQEIERSDVSLLEKGRNLVLLTQTRIMIPLLNQSADYLQERVELYRLAVQHRKREMWIELLNRMGHFEPTCTPVQ
ncbi:hypothetical protein J3Q64DRAFT_1832119 [Phycomyces blakesleeanus]|uniref:Uncharacterized protein n=2 Tax=Phycomyces blakesleeanus TaxID=4837 RepID=A0A162UGW9_PHYB8|nr:hypothetical protein PHYBLDRAFT_59675 [Phycomyces blakesleeanus NRRL 1555(-)]OAD76142.1 hypothetical protein PHYBLDRAFT_59675 [Phycomyces blakesleeanus NRRL 1555(-)]|eukprot:XP_018294182.1 hypothetical protein PHYBLDRAFT_59675 [Phycomyces blakesleeanus NRRL 1555(-)]